MRLEVLERGHRAPQRLLLGALRLLRRGRPPPDIMRVVLYRPEVFGTPFRTWVQAVLRGPSPWSVGERELIAAVVSQANRCPFCAVTHGQVAARALADGPLVDLVVADWRHAPVDERLRAAFSLAERLTQDPDGATAVDVQPLRAAGLDGEAIADVVHITAVFNVINRVANAFAFRVPTAAEAAAGSARLLQRGY
jgi:uncharacterized peroxidase-related enzyme